MTPVQKLNREVIMLTYARDKHKYWAAGARKAAWIAVVLEAT